MIVFVWTEIKICVYYRLRLQSSSCGRSLSHSFLFFNVYVQTSLNDGLFFSSRHLNLKWSSKSWVEKWMDSVGRLNIFKITSTSMGWKYGKRKCLASSTTTWSKNAIVSWEKRSVVVFVVVEISQSKGASSSRRKHPTLLIFRCWRYCVERLALQKVPRLWITSKATLWHCGTDITFEFVSAHINSRSQL